MGSRWKVSSFVLAIILILSGVALAAPGLALVPQVVSLKATTPPIIDGKLDDEVWLEAAIYGSTVSGFINQAGTALAKQETVAHLAYDDANLYLAIIAFKSDMAKLAANDDSIEVSWDTTPGNNSSYRIMNNSLGTKSGAKLNDSSWNPKWQVATQVLEDRWISEISIPFSEMGLEAAPQLGEIWGFNITRNDTSSGQRSSWATTYGHYVAPKLFENLIFGASIQAPYQHNWAIQSQSSGQISSGVSHTSISLDSGRAKQAVQIAAIDLDDPFTEVLVASAQGGVGRLETVRNIAQEHIEQNMQVVAAINGDFFSSVGTPSSLQIIAGEIISSPALTKVAVVITRDRRVELVHQISMKASLTIVEGKLGIDVINRDRGVSHNNHLYVYTTRFGNSTRTPEETFEVILTVEDSQARLRPGEPLVATVQEFHEGGNAVIPPQGIVLSASGQKAEWLRNHLQLNVSVELSVSYDQGVNNAQQVLGSTSYALIKDGKLTPEILNRESGFFADRHPRTFAGTKDNTLYLVVVDGRRAGHSDGVTLAEGAYYLQTLGMEQAINLDGGGSSTYLFRPLGESSLELANRPSDNSERPVINAFVITNTAPVEAPAQLLLEPSEKALVLKGSTLRFDVKAVDRNLNPVVVSRADLSWEAEGTLGTILEDGDLLVADGEGTGILRVSLDEVTASIELRCVDTIANLALHTDATILKPGTTVTFLPEAKSLDDTRILISADALEWSVEGDIGTINSRGELAVGGKTGSGTVIARYGSMEARKTVYIIK